MTTTTLKKPSRITTTVRFDPDLKNRAEQFAQLNHMDFTTFLHFSVETTMRYGGKIEPVWQVSPTYMKRLEEIDKDIEAYDRGDLEGVAGPFSTREEILEYLNSIG